MEKNNINIRRIKVSLVINIMIFIITIIASIIMFTGFKFMHGYDISLQSTKIGMFKFFTVESNILIGIVALIFAIKEIELINGKIDDISTKMYILKLIATTAVGLTFVVVFGYLGPISKNGIPSMLMNSNLFFHLIIPVTSMINFIFFEKTNKIKFKYTFYGLMPTVLYGIFYVSNVLIHVEDGQVSKIYDWYWFVQNGLWTAVIVAPMILLITYIICLVLWRLNILKEKGKK